MVRFFIILVMTLTVFLGNENVFSQIANPSVADRRGERIFKPLKNIRDRADNGVLKDAKSKVAERANLDGKLAEKRKERSAETAKEKADLKKFEAAELKKIEAEAKVAELQAKALAEADAEKNKPWDVAAPENLESDSDLLKMAAASKQDQDLTPKKIKALQYLATIGCNKDPSVEKAILAGLKDFNAEVRLAAIQAVIAAYRGSFPAYGEGPLDPYQASTGVPQFDCPVLDTTLPTESALEKAEKAKAAEEAKKAEEEEAKAAAAAACEACDGKRHRKRILKGRCKKCKGDGCGSCNYCGEVTEVYTDPCMACCPAVPVPCQTCQVCSPHDGCKSCCPSEKILEELKRIAFEPDPQRENCKYEPSIDVRNLALEALNLCPPIADEVDPGPTPVIPETGGDKKPDVISESGDGGESPSVIEIKPEEEKKKEGDGTSDDDIVPLKKEGDATTQSDLNSPFQSAGFSSSSRRMLNARLAKFLENDAYLVEFDGDYLIPQGHQLLVRNQAGSAQIVEVIGSEVGFVRVVPIEGQLFDQTDARLSIGIVQQ